MCHVQPEHVSMLRLFGGIMLTGGIISYIKDVTYFRGVIYKANDPFGYWTGTIGMSFLGCMTLFDVYFCA